VAASSLSKKTNNLQVFNCVVPLDSGGGQIPGLQSACSFRLPGLMKAHHPWMRYKNWQQWWIT